MDVELEGVTVRAGCVPLIRRSDGRQCLRLAISADEDHGAARLTVHRQSDLLDSTTLDVRAGLQQARLFVPPAETATTVRGRGRAGRRPATSVPGRGRASAALALVPRPPLAPRPRLYGSAGAGAATPPRVPRFGARPCGGGRCVPVDDREQRRARTLARQPAARPAERARRVAAGRPVRSVRPAVHDARPRGVDRRARSAAPLRARVADETRRRGRDGDADGRAGRPAGARARPCRCRCPVPLGRTQLGRPRHAVPDRRRGAAPRVPLEDPQRQASARLAHRQSARRRLPRGQPARTRGVGRPRRGAAPRLPRCARLARVSVHRGARRPGRAGALPAGRPAPAGAGNARRQRRSEPGPARSHAPGTSDTPSRSYAPRPRASSSRRSPQDDLQTFTGDWADWWVDGLGSSARTIGFNRRAQAAVRTGQTLAVLSGSTVEADSVYERIALFDEHTWGAADPQGEAESGRESGAVQWETKAALATSALASSEALVDSAAASFRTARRVSSVLVLNPSGFARTDVVSVLLPELHTVAVVDAETHERVPHAVGPPEPSRNRPRGRPLSFVATNVPPLGYRRFDLVADGAAPEAGGGSLENETLPDGNRRRKRLRDERLRQAARSRARRLRELVRPRPGRARSLRQPARRDRTASAGQRADHGIDGRRTGGARS